MDRMDSGGFTHLHLLPFCHSVLEIADVYFAEQMYGIHIKSRFPAFTGMTIMGRDSFTCLSNMPQ